MKLSAVDDLQHELKLKEQIYQMAQSSSRVL